MWQYTDRHQCSAPHMLELPCMRQRYAKRCPEGHAFFFSQAFSTVTEFRVDSPKQSHGNGKPPQSVITSKAKQNSMYTIDGQPMQRHLSRIKFACLIDGLNPHSDITNCTANLIAQQFRLRMSNGLGQGSTTCIRLDAGGRAHVGLLTAHPKSATARLWNAKTEKIQDIENHTKTTVLNQENNIFNPSLLYITARNSSHVQDVVNTCVKMEINMQE